MTTRRTKLVFVLAVLLITACSLAQAQQPPSKDEKSEELRTGAITGRVVNENGQALASALVSVRAYGSLTQGRNTTTDVEGNFQINGLDVGAYQVFAGAPAYITLPRDPDSSQSPYSRIGDSLRLELVKGGVITGVVTNAADEPVVYVIVRAHMIRDSLGQPPRSEVSNRQKATDDRGVYRIYGLTPGTYIVSAGNGGDYYSRFNTSAYDADVPTYAPSSIRDTAAEINVHAGEEISNVDIRYRGEQGRVVSGIAKGAGNPLESQFSVTLTTAASQGMRMNLTTFQPPGGRGFAFFGVADGDYDLTANMYTPGGDPNLSEPKRIKVRGSDITGIELLAKPLGTIVGRVALLESKLPECKAKRRPLFAETVISAWHNEKDATKDQPQFIWALGAPTVPDNQGNFTLRNLAPGQYRFSTRPFAKYWYLQSFSLPAATSGASTGTTSKTVDAARTWTAVKPGDRISGLILTLAEGAASFHGQIKLVDGQKLPAKSFVYLVPAEREKAEDVLRFFALQVEADGTFAMNNLAPGRYWALARTARENESNILSKLRLPEESEFRANLRRDAETAKTEIEFKPCQNLLDYRLPLN